MKNNRLILTFQLLFLPVALFLSVFFLIKIPSVLVLAQNRVTSLNYLDFQSNNLAPQVAGVTKVAHSEIIDTGMLPPYLSAAACLVEDLESGKILYQKNMNQRLSPASITKLMTALVAIEYFSPESILTVYKEGLVSGSSMGLVLNEKLTFRSLLYGMLLNSGNDAAYTIALNYPGGMNNFVAKMNEKAKFLGFVNTHFQNPAGFDDENHYSSAYDLAIIAKEAYKNPGLARIFATQNTTVLSFDQTKLHVLKNLNQLLGKDGVLGIKTGFTEKSGENLVGLVERNDRKVLTVVLDSSDRFGETKGLMDWVYSNFVWKLTL